MRGLIAGAVLILAVAGCSSGGGGKALASSQAPTTPAAETSSSSSSAVSVEQWASLIAERSTPVVEEANKRANCPLVEEPGGDLTCGIGRLTFALTVKTFGVYLEGGKKDLGEPPAEIADLVARTSAAIAGMDAAQNAYSEACTADAMQDASCTSAQMAWGDAKDKVLGVINAWKPYGA